MNQQNDNSYFAEAENVKKKKTIVCITVLLFAVCGLVWRFLPVHFPNEIEPENVVKIIVFNGNNGDEFKITDPDEITRIVNGITQIAFKKEGFISEVQHWYYLTLINENGEETESLGVQNSRILVKDITQKCMGIYRCDGELSEVGDYLESLEAAQFPDYNKDPDFCYFYF